MPLGGGGTVCSGATTKVRANCRRAQKAAVACPSGTSCSTKTWQSQSLFTQETVIDGAEQLMYVRDGVRASYVAGGGGTKEVVPSVCRRACLMDAAGAKYRMAFTALEASMHGSVKVSDCPVRHEGVA